jgi:hypothetical protein
MPILESHPDSRAGTTMRAHLPGVGLLIGNLPPGLVPVIRVYAVNRRT